MARTKMAEKKKREDTQAADGKIIYATVYPQEYRVESIAGIRVNFIAGYVQYLVKWEGYDWDEATWEPEEHLKECIHLSPEWRAMGSRLEAKYHDEIIRIQSEYPPLTS